MYYIQAWRCNLWCKSEGIVHRQRNSTFGLFESRRRMIPDVRSLNADTKNKQEMSAMSSITLHPSFEKRLCPCIPVTCQWCFWHASYCSYNGQPKAFPQTLKSLLGSAVKIKYSSSRTAAGCFSWPKYKVHKRQPEWEDQDKVLSGNLALASQPQSTARSAAQD